MDLGLKDRHVIVTGASQGIGRCVAEAYAREGARVSIIARRTEALNQVVEAMGGTSKGHAAFATDLIPQGAPEKVLEEITNRQGPVDIAIHNLGGTLGVRDVLSMSEDWNRVWRLNVGIAIDFNRRLVPTMKERGWGRLIHVVSTAADDLSGSGPYSAAKAYLKAYVQIMGRQLAQTGIVASGISPGAVQTFDNTWVKKQKDNPELVADFLDRHQAIGRLGKGDELSPFVLLLGSEHASFACASILPIHGGVM